MANAALTYAEVTLGVHACYERANETQAQLDEVLTALDKAQDARRLLVEQIADREADLLIAEQGKHASQSATWMDQHMRTAKQKDTMLAGLRAQLRDSHGEIGGLEYDVEAFKARVRIECARMEELGGYFNYLAAIKQAENLTKTTQQETGT
jgi:hypothetical protein